jgi:CHAD domain-containing protein
MAKRPAVLANHGNKIGHPIYLTICDWPYKIRGVTSGEEKLVGISEFKTWCEMTVSDAAYRMLACRYIEGQIKALKRQVRGARRAQDIEYIHQARVASRRLRAALRMFSDCFPTGRVDRWRRQIKRLTRRLGSARDTDVQIEFLKKFISGLPGKSKKFKPGLRRLMLRLKQRRQAIQLKVIRVLDRLYEKQVLAEIIKELKAITTQCSPGHSSIKSQFIFQQAGEHINSRLEELFSFECSLDDPGNGKGHHRMRIAAKHLRYTLEICSLPFENRLSEHIEGMKRLQSLLGKLHDCDVWLDDIKTFSRDEKARMMEYLGSVRAFKRLKRGIDYLVRQRRKDRRILFEQSVQFWKQLAEQDFWNKLNLIFEEHDITIARTGRDSATGKKVTYADKNS